MISCISLFSVLVVYVYIYIRKAIFQYNFYSILFTFLAFLLLFIGSGKQVVYQQLVQLNKIDYKEKKKRQKIWKWGLLFYELAVPTVIVSNILYFVDLKVLIDKIRINILRDKVKWFSISNQSFKEDIRENLKISYYKKNDNEDWRFKFMIYAQLFPMFFLIIDMSINRLQIKLGNIKIFIIFTIFYILITLLAPPVYYENLNWRCSKNISYLYDKSS